MNILILCKRHYTNKDLINDKFGRLFHFPRHWVNYGHPVTVIAMDYRNLPISSITIENILFHSIPFPSFFVNFLLKTLKLARNSSPDIIIASGDSHIGFFGLCLARHMNIPFVFDLYHHYADFGTNKIPGMKPMYYHALRKADLVVCDSRPLETIVSKYNKHTKIAAQGTDNTLFNPLDKVACKKALNLDISSSYIGYTGAIDNRFDQKLILTLLNSKDLPLQNIKLLIAGPNLSNFDLNHQRIVYLGKLPQDQVPLVIGASEVMLIPYQDTPLAQTCNPCKLSEYIACERPIVASAISNIADYLPRSNHLLYKPGNTNEFFRSLLQQLRLPITEDISAALGWDTIAMHYLSWLKEVTLT